MNDNEARITIADGVAQAVVMPAMGGGLASYDLVDGVPLFRKLSNILSPIDQAHFALVPFSGRISGGGFTCDGIFHPMPPATPMFDTPIHGNGWLEPWSIADRSASAVTLTLNSDGPGPLRYAARQGYALDGGALTMTLAVTNRAAIRLPHGLGFHPWFPRTLAMTLEAAADAVWRADENTMPVERLGIAARPAWNFAQAKPLPPDLIDNAFDGWNGCARIAWPEHGVAMDIAASPELGRYIVYSPSAASDFFCFEPVSHAPDAHNLPGGAETHGLRLLEQGATLTVSCRFSPKRLG